jgi:5-methylcytosine-specific restriction protein A
MPTSAPKPCSHPGCGKLVRDGTSRCEKHPPKVWAKREDAPKRITGRKLQQLRKELFASNPLCVACDKLGLVRLATQRDHTVSLAEGGKDVPENTQGLCDDCHEAKSLAEALRGRRRAQTPW